MTDQKEPRLRLVKENDPEPTITNISENVLERVLRYLNKNDDLFEYNVPDDWRDPAKPGLQNFLVRTYDVDTFEVQGESAVRKDIKMYDFVRYNSQSPGFNYKFYIKPGMKGVITSVDHSKEMPLSARWPSCDECPKEMKLTHTGEGMSLLPKGFFRREVITNRMEILANAEPGRLLEPTEVDFKYAYYLPIGTKGIVTKIDKSADFPVSVVFGQTQGYIPSDNGISCKYNVLTILRENHFNIDTLIKEFS